MKLSECIQIHPKGEGKKLQQEQKKKQQKKKQDN